MTESRHAWLMSWARGLAAAAAVGFFLAVSGAFGSGGAPFGWRLVYWMSLMLMGGVVGGVIANAFTAWAAMDERPLLRGVLMSLAIAAPVTLLVWAATTIYTDSAWRASDIPNYLGPVYLISAAMTLIGHLLDRPAQTHAAAAEAPPARFLDRLPPRLKGAELHAVAAEDHYLRLYTDRGTDLILMRLSDAVIELEGLEGAQVHRSWWVAKDAVLGAKRGDGRATLAIKGGIEAPVSRRYAPALRKAGWY
jgi:DNA-binding LytR/AlgR family response regulator